VKDNQRAENDWDRSPFAMSGDELDIHDALAALVRLLRSARLRPEMLEAVRNAYQQLEAEPSR
jgi:hypothetical protein